MDDAAPTLPDEELRLFSEGVRLFNDGRFFEAHDVWEELWMETRGRKRLFFQGLIQASVAYYHAFNANNSGAASLMERAVQKLERYAPQECGINLHPLLPVLSRHARLFAERRTEPVVLISEHEPPRLTQHTHIP